MMKLNTRLFLCVLASFSLTTASISVVRAQQESPQSTYFMMLSSLCGERFEGAMTYPEDEQHDFANKLLVASFETCSETLIEVPFQVGEDQSRTWIFSKTSDGLALKHDHRHADGSVDEESNYGGVALSPGTSNAQAFAADEFTKTLIPAAATNVWNVSLSSDQSELTYHLERHNKPRFTAVLKRIINEVE